MRDAGTEFDTSIVCFNLAARKVPLLIACRVLMVYQRRPALAVLLQARNPKQPRHFLGDDLRTELVCIPPMYLHLGRAPAIHDIDGHMLEFLLYKSQTRKNMYTYSSS